MRGYVLMFAVVCVLCLHIVCEYFLSSRGCIKGGACEYIHPSDPSNPSSTPLHTTAIAPHAQVSLINSAKKMKICEYFTGPRGCIKGSGCDYIHPGHATLASADGTVPDIGVGGEGVQREQCPYLNTARGCLRGEQCNFMHDTSRVCQFWNTGKVCLRGEQVSA